MINVIVACDREGGIGKNHGIPWPPIKEDMKWFRESTMGHVVVMGSSTWNSFGMKKPLPGRKNVVFTSKPESCPGADIYLNGNVEDELKKLEKEFPGLIIWVIGGSKIINQCQNIINRWFITKIDDVYNCDTFIPRIWDNESYHCVHEQINYTVIVSIVPRMYHDLTFEIWELK